MITYPIASPLINPTVFDQVQHRLLSRSIRRNKTGRVYLFSGLFICRECGARMVSQYTGNGQRMKTYYRCNKAYLYHECTHNKLISEENLDVKADLRCQKNAEQFCPS